MGDQDSSTLSYNDQIAKDFGQAQDYIEGLEGSGQDGSVEYTTNLGQEITIKVVSETITVPTEATTSYEAGHNQQEVDFKFWILLGLVLLLVLSLLAVVLKYYISHGCLQQRVRRTRQTGANPRKRRHSETDTNTPTFSMTDLDRREMNYRRMSDSEIRDDKIAFFALRPELGDYNEARIELSDLDRVKLDKLDKLHLQQQRALARLSELNAAWEKAQRDFSRTPFDFSNPKTTERFSAQVELESALYREADNFRRLIHRHEDVRHSIVNKFILAMATAGSTTPSSSSHNEIPLPKPMVPTTEEDTARSLASAMEDLQIATNQARSITSAMEDLQIAGHQA